MIRSGFSGLKRGFRGLKSGLRELACVNHTRKPIISKPWPAGIMTGGPGQPFLAFSIAHRAFDLRERWLDRMKWQSPTLLRLSSTRLHRGLMVAKSNPKEAWVR